MERIESITEISEVLQTRGYPVKAFCSDFNTYVVKHNNGAYPANKLKNELLGHVFLRLWDLKTPQVKLVVIKDRHIEKHLSNTCQYRFFRGIPCFGSQFLDRAVLFNQFFQNMSASEYRSLRNLMDIIKISLFDMWMANEDRTPNNFNLLLNPEPGGNCIYAIDHEDCFNSHNLHRGLAPLTNEESILSAPEVRKLLKIIRPSNNDLEQIESNYYLCTEKCKQKLDEVLSDIPVEWQVNKQEFKSQLLSNLFSENWLRTAFKKFRILLSKNIKK